MKVLLSLVVLLVILTSITQADDSQDKANQNKSVGSQTVTREKIRALKDKNQKTVNALEDIEDKGAEEGDDEEEDDEEEE
jgi:hypothetical protein